MTGRLLLVAALVLVVAAVAVAYRRRRTLDEQLGAVDATSGDARWPPLPDDVTGGVPAWVIFTTPLCASCDAVRADLVAHDPSTLVVTVDATEQPALADRYEVRRAPTTVRADRDGRITQRLVGPEAVRAYLRSDDGRRAAAPA